MTDMSSHAVQAVAVVPVCTSATLAQARQLYTDADVSFRVACGAFARKEIAREAVYAAQEQVNVAMRALSAAKTAHAAAGRTGLGAARPGPSTPMCCSCGSRVHCVCGGAISCPVHGKRCLGKTHD
jgi:hypothetical protein